ncbi:hypothetical protein [Bacillus sp. CGMCC 1.16541]|uniref:hypothetical protein n=1 Tax=Bacillus sp. CGMCC 1.16541 TaxID=2185143 RepID=UPI000D72BD4F|nr:hypothetical protein [Bacillus sp. CGMCC 1.16541]
MMWFVLFIAILLLTACLEKETTTYEYTLKGESEHWTGEYSVKGTEVWNEKNGRTGYEHESEDELILTFTGMKEEKKSIKELEYSYETTVGAGSGTTTFESPNENDDIIITHRGASIGAAKMKEDEVIKITVKWNGQEETFQLQNGE